MAETRFDQRPQPTEHRARPEDTISRWNIRARTYPPFPNPRTPTKAWPGEVGLLGANSRETFERCVDTLLFLEDLIEEGEHRGLEADELHGIRKQVSLVRSALRTQLKVIDAHNDHMTRANSDRVGR